MAVNGDGARLAALEALAERHAAAIQLICSLRQNISDQRDMADEQDWNPERVRSEANLTSLTVMSDGQNEARTQNLSLQKNILDNHVAADKS